MSLRVARAAACALQSGVLRRALSTLHSPPSAQHAGRGLATAASASSAGSRRSTSLPPPPPALPSGGSDAEDASEDAHDHPELAPPLFASRRALQPIDVAENIVKGVREDRRAGARERSHVLAVLVDNEAGVLSKISGLLSARGFNIESLTVSPTNVPDLSRMTVVIRDVPSEGKAAQALKQLSDVVNVWQVRPWRLPIAQCVTTGLTRFCSPPTPRAGPSSTTRARIRCSASWSW
jgi:hypothetical protein